MMRPRWNVTDEELRTARLGLRSVEGAEPASREVRRSSRANLGNPPSRYGFSYAEANPRRQRVPTVAEAVAPAAEIEDSAVGGVGAARTPETREETRSRSIVQDAVRFFSNYPFDSSRRLREDMSDTTNDTQSEDMSMSRHQGEMTPFLRDDNGPRHSTPNYDIRRIQPPVPASWYSSRALRHEVEGREVAPIVQSRNVNINRQPVAQPRRIQFSGAPPSPGPPDDDDGDDDYHDRGGNPYQSGNNGRGAGGGGGWNPPENIRSYSQPTQRITRRLTGPQQMMYPQNQNLSGIIGEQQRQTRMFLARQSPSSKLPKFDGNPLEWPLFIHHYQSSTRDCEYTQAENMARLEKSIRGEARQLVQALMIVRENSDAVIARLQQRYGRPEYVVQALVEIARKTPAIKENKLNTILDFAAAVNNLVVTIQSLNVPAHLQNPTLIKELVDRLPDTLKLQWGMQAMGWDTPTLTDLSRWLERVAAAASCVTTPTFQLPSIGNAKEKKKKGESTFVATTSTSEVPASNSKGSPTCLYCKKAKHNITKCFAFKRKKVEERWQFAKEKRLCFLCLRDDHRKGDCSAPLCSKDGCGGSHHFLLHVTPSTSSSSSPAPSNDQERPENIEEIAANMNNIRESKVYLRISPVTLYSPSGKECIVNALFDEASTATILSSAIADFLEITGPLDPLTLRWTDGSVQHEAGSRRLNLMIGPVGEKKKYNLSKVRTVNKLNIPSQFMPYEEIVRNYNHLRGIKFKILRNQPPLLLISQRHISLTLPREIREADEESPVATCTKLGWVLHGPTKGIEENNATYSCFHSTDDDVIHDLVKESFALESVGLSPVSSLRSKDDEEAEKIMARVTRRMGDRWETGLLWRREPNCGSMSGDGGSLRDFAVPSSERVSLEPEPVPQAGEVDCGAVVPTQVGSEWAFPGSQPLACSPPSLSFSLPPSRETAMRRLLSLEKKLNKNPELKEEFKKKINHYVTSGYARKLTKIEESEKNPKEWYLPIFSVTHPNKPGKIRLVWDAACSSHGKCLNDFLYTGPDLLNSLPGILLKFRQKLIAFSGDITEMFHQVRIRKEDCPAQRFLWRDNPAEQPSTYQLEVMMFGSCCSPYCAQYIRNVNALEFSERFPEATNAIVNLHYMDDCLGSVETVEEARKLLEEITLIHKKGGFHIGKWISNSPELLQSIPEEDRTSTAKDLSLWSEIPTERALGIFWLPNEDMFTYKVNVDRVGEGIMNGAEIPTKRIILRLVMLVWDPLGFLQNYLIKARILLQQLWRYKLDWDDQIPEEMLRRWKTWVSDLPLLQNLRIPRCYSPRASRCENNQLHIFADSSEAAYCAVAYLRIADERGVEVVQVLAKARVAPLKPISIPRLELQAAVVAAKIGKLIKEELTIPIKSTHYWTDSMTVLKWLRNDARRYQQFVANRIGNIQELTHPDEWRWVPGRLNPADDATREGRADLNNDSRWRCGPDFLKDSPDEWPGEEVSSCPDDHDPEMKKEIMLVAVEERKFAYLPDSTRFSKYLRLHGASRAVLVAANKFKKNENQQQQSDLEERAEQYLYIRSQWESFPLEMHALENALPIQRSSRVFRLEPILDEKGVMRMNSRLQSVEQRDLKQPIILDGKNPFTKLLVEYYHQLYLHQTENIVYNEIRQKFWILNLKVLIKQVKRFCLTCKLRVLRGKPPIMGALPEIRTTPQERAFTITGMDYFGPLFVTNKRSTEKRYGVIFTCMTTRAVHLELASDLSTDSCIMAIRRFISRRGHPREIHSDNGTNLRGACKELRLAMQEIDQDKLIEKMTVKGIKFVFIPAHSPHFGACWERLVRSVKSALSVIMKDRHPKEEVLRTLFAEVEAIVNSRPLTEVSADPSAPEALTPFHFLIGTSSAMQPPGDFSKRDADIGKRWRQAQALANMFWSRWQKEYLHTLQQRKKWHDRRPNLEVGDVVVLFDDSLKQRSYPIGIIVRTCPGRDQVVRVCDVKTTTGVYRRPVIKIGPLGFKSVNIN